jgi:hypothetical protein
MQSSNGLHRHIYMMTITSSNENINTKLAFKQFVVNNFVKIEHYHADTDQLGNIAFINHCSSRQQQLT